MQLRQIRFAIVFSVLFAFATAIHFPSNAVSIENWSDFITRHSSGPISLDLVIRWMWVNEIRLLILQILHTLVVSDLCYILKIKTWSITNNFDSILLSGSSLTGISILFQQSSQSITDTSRALDHSPKINRTRSQPLI